MVRLDEIGYWSEIKLDIVREYAAAYSKIMNNQTFIRSYYYIDGFAGAGVHVSKQTGQSIPGSPANALQIEPPFSGYYFIDLDGNKAALLQELARAAENVSVYSGDCNTVLLNEIFPKIQYAAYVRALCLLDPYGLHLDWTVIQTAGQSRAIEIFLNFPLMDMQMNVLKHHPEKVSPQQQERMNLFWGDDSWRRIAYKQDRGLFGPIEQREPHEVLVQAFKERLQDVAGFRCVPEPIPMRNTKGGIVYYLFFASPNNTGSKIVHDIFSKYRNRGAP